jgi:hypothetical protein
MRLVDAAKGGPWVDTSTAHARFEPLQATKFYDYAGTEVPIDERVWVGASPDGTSPGLQCGPPAWTVVNADGTVHGLNEAPGSVTAHPCGEKFRLICLEL